MELMEYEQYYQIWDEEGTNVNRKAGTDSRHEVEELLFHYRRVFVSENMEIDTELMQLYTDMEEYRKAAFWMKRKEMLESSVRPQPQSLGRVGQQEENEGVDNALASKILKVFAGREDIFCEEELESFGRRKMEMKPIPLSEKKVKEHLSGNITVGTYVQRPNSTVKYIVVDIDISRRILLQHEKEQEIITAYMERTLQKAGTVIRILNSLGIQGYIECSGYRGYHVWIFFREWIPVRYANMLCEIIENKVQEESGDITVEFFPNRTRIKPGKFGQVIKIPFGKHLKTGKYSFFLDENFCRITDVKEFLDNLSFLTLADIKRILAMHSGSTEMVDEKKVDENLDGFGELPENIRKLLQKCNLMRYLCQKARKTGYLTHFERLSVLYVMGHLGEDGKQFVHQIMSYTLNYQYHTTERFIQRLPDKPVSCLKLRDQYKQITAEYGCNCDFRRSRNCYPSPVLHVISQSSDLQNDITLPVSRTLTKEKERIVIEEINVHKKAQNLAGRILELKKQKRGIDQAIAKVERELEQIYDNLGIDCLEIEMGLLVRRKKENGYEWLIEI